MKKGIREIIGTVLTILTFGCAGLLLYFAYVEDKEAKAIKTRREKLANEMREFTNAIRNPKLKL